MNRKIIENQLNDIIMSAFVKEDAFSFSSVCLDVCPSTSYLKNHWVDWDGISEIFVLLTGTKGLEFWIDPF